MTDGGDGWAPVDNSDQDPADDLGEPKEKIMKKELNDILEIGTTNGEKADKTEENEKEHKEMEKKENGVEKTDKPSTENKESDNGSDEKKPESESKSPEMPDEEDDIPLDLILKEEQIEVIANGTMATDEKDPKDESCAFEHCGLCHNRVILGHAKLLGCLHTFCTTCLDKQEMQRTSADGSATKVLCPVCRCLTPRSLLAENHFVKNDEDKDEVQSKEAKKVCVSCEDEGEIEAEKYCLDCNEWLCAECVAAHKRVKLTKGHTLSDEPPKITRDKSESYCPEHPTEPLQLFCDSCDTLTCRDCQLQKHRDHRYDYVKEAAARERHMLVNAQPSLLAKQAALVEFQKIASERLVQLEQREDLLTNEIDSYIGEIIAAIKQKQEEFHKTVGAVIGERKKEVNGQLNTSKKLLKAINHSQNFVKYIDDPSKTRGLLCARKLVKDYFNLIIREPTPTMTTLAHCNVNVTFNKNNNLIHSLVSNQLASVHFEQPVRPPPGQHPKHLPQMMGARPHSRSHMQRAHRPPQNPGSQMLRPNSSIPTQVQQITSLQRQQRQAAAAAHLAQNGHQRISPQSIHHQNHRNQFYPGHPMPPSHAGPSGHPQPTPPQAPSPHQIRNSPVMSPNFIPGRPHSTDSGHSSDVARQPAATPPIVSSSIVKSEENEEWCAICWNGGELLCCDSCPKVFHLDCHIPEIKDQIPEGTDFNCSLCVYRKGNSSVLAVCRFIFTSILSDRELDKLQHFSNSADQTDDYRQLLRNPITYSKIRKRLADKTTNQMSSTANQNGASLVTNQITPYHSIEHFLTDIVTFLFNIKKYSADRLVLDQSELAKHKISSLIRLTAPKALHYWMSSQMRPVSPLRNFVKRIAKPKQADSDSDDDSKSKRIKIENTN